MPALPSDAKTNFNTLLRAAVAGHLALLDCSDKDGAQVPTIVAINKVDGSYEFVPLARMFTGNPYDELMPPAP